MRWSHRTKMIQMYNDGVYKIEKDLNLVRLIKMIKRINILMKNSLMTQKIDFEIAHQPENCIDLEDNLDDVISLNKDFDEISSFDDSDSFDSNSGDNIRSLKNPYQPFLKKRLTFLGR